MKKFFVGLLSLFLLFGAGFLTACGSKGTTLTLSKETIEIQIYAGEDEGYQIVTAEVEGTDKASISANAKSGYENIVKVTTSKISNTKASIKIEGLNEGYAEITVKSGSQTKYIHATVFSEVSAMSQKIENGIKNNFLIRGKENILDEEKLIDFTPSSKSRRNITWSLAEQLTGVSLVGTNLTIDEGFIGDSISLIPTTEKGVTTSEPIILPVIDKIEEEINLAFSYSKASAFEYVDEENNTFNIVPNVVTDEKYNGYILIDYMGDLKINGFVLDSQGCPTNDIVVNRDGSISDRPVFKISASDKSNINDDYTIYFEIGYQEYSYSLNTLNICPITIKAREMVNGVIISTYGSGNIENSTQTLYTEYADSDYSTVYGQQFNVMMIPTTVLDATNKYSITLSIEEAGGTITEKDDNGNYYCPVEIWYRNVANGNEWTQIVLEEDKNTGYYITNAENLPSVTSLYIKATNHLAVQSAEGLKLTFTSYDNKNISSSFNLKLVRSVSKVDFQFPDGEFKIDSSEENKTHKKIFTLKGQTSIEGLYIINNSNAVIFDEIHYISNNEESVTFEVAVTLKRSSYGITTLDSYQIAHKNGLISDAIAIDIFLPLKEAGIFVDNANNKSNSIIDTDYNQKTYSAQGNLLQSAKSESLSSLMLKNNTTTPLIYSYNEINGISAVANLSVQYYDYISGNGNLSEFLALSESDEGVLEIINRAKNVTESSIAYFTSDYSSIITKGVGYTYAVVSFIGKGTESLENIDENGNVNYVRILKIESLVTPEGMNIAPDSDKIIDLYSMESLATSDENLTRKEISIKFSKTNVTYTQITNVHFISRNEDMGKMSISEDGKTISWEKGRYVISNATLTNEGITFTIGALHTFGEYVFTDTLDVHYIIRNGEDEKVYDIASSIKITINNAQRIESVIWDNYDPDGLYFEVGDNNPQYMLFATTPTNARNKNMAYVITDGEGKVNANYVEVSDEISSETLAVKLLPEIAEGMIGYIYILPSDAIYNNQIKYYYFDEVEKEGYVSPNALGEVINSNGQTYYEYLIANAYFKSNATGGVTKIVNFKEILLKVKITIADGKNFDHAYRIYDEASFNSIGRETELVYTADKYYTIMNSLEIDSERKAISTFNGGLQGYNNEVTIKLNGSNFASTLSSTATIRNIKFNGMVNGNGFVANINEGTILNVAIDVDGICASKLVALGTYYVGGLAGINKGTIQNSRVLGLEIVGKDATIGGIAGQNSGKITNSAVEFYNLYTGQDENENDTYGVNKFDGYITGAIVGEIALNSEISYTYAYDYTLTSVSKCAIISVLPGYSGAFAGTINVASGKTAIINYSFSVVGLQRRFNGYDNDNGDNSGVKLTNYYIGYYDGESYTIIPDSISSNVNFVQINDNNFDSEINGGFPYLKNLQQSKRVTDVEYSVTTVENNGYYKSVAVDKNNGLLFYYSLKNNFLELNSAEKNDLLALNTISLSELVDDKEVCKDIIITSSNATVAKIVGSSIILQKTGETILTLSSKQNVKLNKQINVKVINPLSRMQISWIDIAGNVNYVEENAQLSIQKTRSRDFAVSFYRTQVYLGGLATAYDFVENDLTITLDDANLENAVENQKISNKEFKLLAHDNSVLTNFKVNPQILDINAGDSEEIYQDAINYEFARTFKVLPTEGVISFAISGETLTISPSINASVKAEIMTTAESDSIYPIVSFNDTDLILSKEEGSNLYRYSFIGDTTPILEAVVNTISKKINTQNGTTTYVFDINFAVAQGYKTSISQEYDFDVILMSESGNSSEEWNGSFSIHVSQQEFTNIDVSNRKISSSLYSRDENNNYVEVYSASDETAVLAPGNSSILEVNVNPDYAYYDYVEFAYSGAKVSNAVNVVVVEPFGESNYQFTKKAIENNNIETINSKLIYRPSADEKTTIFYKLWINTTVNRDTTLKFTATFYRQNGEMLDYVNYYITVSYLTEPSITVDGASTTYLAKGSSADVQIDVLLDQKVDSLIIDGEDIKGISISELSEGNPDPERGVKTYTAKVYASVLASTSDKNTFYLKARVSRELNGAKEIKDSIATIVIVDFKIDTSSIAISGQNNGNLTIWQGVSKPLMVDYNILPESYLYPSTQEMADAIQKLRVERDIFGKHQVYPAVTDAQGNLFDLIKDNSTNLTYVDPLNKISHTYEDLSYFVNYTYNEKSDEYERQSLYERLFIVVNNESIPVSDTSIDKPFEVIENTDGTVSFRGIKISGSVRMILKTYITAGYVTQTIETPFNVIVEAYSDPDLPIKISNSTDFNNLNPNNVDRKATNDYILENDIYLENYTSFNTDIISSLDGNGHTIFIKSYKLENVNSSVLNLALFNTVRNFTTLKNVRVNLYNGGQLTIDVSKYKTINIAGLAIENEGVITNCEVVSFYTNDRAMGELIADSACMLHNKPQGINVNYVDATGTDSIYLPDNANWSSQIAGFVISNTGRITNSRVGGEEIIIVGAEKQTNGEATGYTYASKFKLDTFHIIGQGNIAGFVLTNSSGYITSSYVKNVDIENQSNSINFYTAGFAGTNNSSILTSYVEGAPTDKDSMPKDEYSQYAFEGTSIRSKLGYIVGFIYNNSGSIKDSYSNILIANSMDATRVYYASGFVYMNEGVVENCYSASQIANSKYSQMNFSGVNESGDLLKGGQYINCYFFNKAYKNSEDPNDYTTESQYGTGAQLISKPSETSGYYGFAIADGENDGIWRTDEQRGITLIEANKTTISHRYTYYVDENSFEGITGEDSLGRKYILPYSVLTFVDTNLQINTSLGSDYNPILIYDAEDFMEISETSTSIYVKQYFNENAIWGSYRLVNNINLLDSANGEETVALPSSNKAFAGRLYGNGFSISGISISADSKAVAFGLFASVEKRINSTPIITNLDLVVSQVIAGDVVMVGGLAGYIKDAIIINLDLRFENDNSMVTGLNFVGGLAGLASGNNIIKNINITNPKAMAERRADIDDNTSYFANANELQLFRTQIKNNLNYNTSVETDLIKNIKNKYSYAGSLIGFVDNYSVDNLEFDINQAENYSINNIRVSGRVYVQGQVAGGIIGLTGYQTNVRDMGITINSATQSSSISSKILSTRYFAGGAIGQSFGAVSRTFAVYDEATQQTIENNISNFYTGSSNLERGQLDLFSSGSSNYTQEYIGGLIGYVGSGKLEISYSKLNVTATSAKYAGGLIGGMEVSSALTYQVETDRTDEAYTKYLLHEVYATGDVRGSIYAGGIIGLIKGETSRVALLAVNGFNMFTTYDYETNTYLQIGEGIGNISNMIKANSIVGQFMNKEGKTQEIDLNNYSSYLILMQAKESYANGDKGVTVRKIASVGYYEGYYENSGKLVTLNIFGNIDGVINDSNTLYTTSRVYAISRPSLYTSSAVGHTYTQAGFLNSGAWNVNNWVHNSADLFPTIRYKRTYEVVYLDAFNIEDVFTEMSGNHIKVIVRGLRTPESLPEDCVDIDLIQFYKENPTAPIITNYSGILEGGGGTNSKTGEDVKIITNKTFISSTAPGFSINNLTIDYYGIKDPETGRTTINMENGLLSNSEISESGISDVTLNLHSPVVSDLNNTAINNVGLLAPAIISTNISGLEINAIKFSEAVLQVENAHSKSEINVGLLAGQARQESTISSICVEEVEFNLENVISINGNDSDKLQNIYAGSYFGQVSRTGDSQPFKVNFGSIVSTSQNTNYLGEQVRPQIMVNAKSFVSPKSNLFVGGYIGNTSGVDNYGYYIDDGVDKQTQIDFNINSNAQNVYVGGLISTVDMTSINGSDISAGAVVKSALYINETQNLYAGGIIAGNIASESVVGNFKASNFDSIDFEVLSYSSNASEGISIPNKESLTGNYDLVEPRYAKTTNAKVGAVAGYTQGSFTYEGTTTKINSSGQAIRLSGKNLKVGSIIGEAGSTATIKGFVVSTAGFMVENKEKANNIVVGGMIGNSLTGNVEISSATNGNPIYQGAVYSNSKDLIFGGILGQFEDVQNSTREDYINIHGTAFGGVVKVYGANSQDANITIGGTVGKIASTVRASIQNNYNYGDVFVEYGSYNETTKENNEVKKNYLTQLSTYNFGGIIGQTSSLTLEGNLGTNSTTTFGIFGNYSLTSSHNSRYSTASDTAHSLFGAGNAWGAVGENFKKSSNYYNHAVSLLVDELGYDIGYSRAYDRKNNQFGYNDFVEGEVATSVVKSALNGVIENPVAGHKLNPASASQMGKNSEESFNGITYYTYSGGNEQLSLKTNDIETATLENIAIIGGSTAQYEYRNSASLVDSLTGYSSISGLALNVNVNDELDSVQGEETLSKTHAPLVGNMKDNSIIYAVNIAGSYDIGGSEATNLAGIVGNFFSGKIFDSSTDIDLTYRAGVDNGSIYGLANSIDSTDANIIDSGMNYKLIENTFTGGSIKTLVKANIFAFTNGSSKTNIKNSYTYTKLDPNDYVNSETDFASNKIGTFGDANIENCQYDIDGLNYVISDAKGTASKRSTIATKIKGIWQVDNKFNYGYPTLKYNYLNNSSYVEKTEETKKGESGYDQYVITNSYTRLGNGKTPETTGEKEYYYLIPNGAVLFNTSITENIALRYNIDLSIYKASGYSRANSDCFSSLAGNPQKTLGEFARKFDGQGNTIKGMTNSLMDTISGGTVMNLRLTDVNITNTPALATTINESSTISNITLSGQVKYTKTSNEGYGYGAIARNINSSTINTTTNMIDLRVENSNSNNDIGGLFGKAENSTILYSSNYGPVHSYHESGSGYEDNVGGLVGYMEGGRVGYSYNATSVLGNYASTSDLSSSQGTFYTGGLVGYMLGETAGIDNSYNSGMIKSGNKTNGSVSYAGGIVGYAESGLIDSCYNEGTVEALGQNPDYTMVTSYGDYAYGSELSSFGNNKYYKFVMNLDGVLELRIINDRNVFAYGIGYSEKYYSIQNSSTKISTQSDCEKEAIIINNGNVFSSGDVVKSWRLADIISDGGGDIQAPDGFNIIFNDMDGHGKEDYANYLNFGTSYNLKKPEDGEDVTLKGWKFKKVEFDLIAINEYGLPTLIGIPMKKDVNMIVQYTKSTKLQDSKVFTREQNEYFTLNIGADITNTVNKATFTPSINEYVYLNKFENKYKICNYNYDIRNQVTTSENTEIKYNTRSQETLTGMPNSISVAGNTYYLADTNNPKTIFTAGLYSTSFTKEAGNILEFNNVAYYDNKDYYTLEVGIMEGDTWTNLENIDTKILSIQKSDNGLHVEAEIYSTEVIENNLTFKLNLNYESSFELNLSNLNYYYVDDYSIGIDINAIQPTQLEGYKIKSADKEYENIVKLSTVQYNTDQYITNEDGTISTIEKIIEPINDNHETFIYLAYDALNERYIYIPNARLYDSAKWIDVNKTEIDINDENGLIVANVKTLIDEKFSGKTLYYRVQGETYAEYEIGDYITENYSASTTFQAGGEQLIENQILSYGSKLENITADNFTLEYLSNSSQYKLSLNSLLALATGDMIILDENEAIMSYSEGILKLDESTTDHSLTIGGNEYVVSIDEANAIIINSTENTEFESQLKEYFAKLLYISNSEAETIKTITGQYKNETNSIKLVSGNLNLSEFSYTNSKTWYLGTTELTESEMNAGVYTIKKSGEDLILSVEDSQKVSYTLNGVTVNYGFVSIEGLREVCVTKLNTLNNSISILNVANSVFNLEILSDDKEIFDQTAFADSNNQGITLDAEVIEKFKGKIDINLNIYNTYKQNSISKNETGEYKLALEDESAQYYVEFDKDLNATSIMQILKSNAGEYITSIEKNISIDEDGKITEESITAETEDGNLLTIVKKNESISYTITSITPEEPTDETKDKYVIDYIDEETGDIHYLTTTEGYYILTKYNSLDEINAISSETRDAINNLINKNFNVLNKYETNIYSTMKILDEVSFIQNNETITYSSLANSYIYNWSKFVVPAYTIISSEFTFENEYENIKVSNNSKFIVTNNPSKIEIYLRDAEDNVKISKVIDEQYKKSISQELSVSITEKLEAKSIILTKDISFTENSFTNQEGVNIVGNGYSISYYGNSFFNTLNKNDTFIKDVSFLGETYNKTLLNTKVKSAGTIVLNNINLYGTVNNVENQSVLAEGKLTISNVKNYVSANGLSANNDLILFNGATINRAENFGTLLGADGNNGANGRNGVSASAGANGQNGQNIVVSSVKVSLENHGIVKVGKGGNGGAGGTYQNAQFYAETKGLTGGQAGSVGKANGISSTITVEDGNVGKEGQTVRGKYFWNEFGRLPGDESIIDKDGNGKLSSGDYIFSLSKVNKTVKLWFHNWNGQSADCFHIYILEYDESKQYPWTEKYARSIPTGNKNFCSDGKTDFLNTFLNYYVSPGVI